MDLGWRANSFKLRGNVDRIEIVDKTNIGDDSFTPLKGGIMGGSVAGLDGFLACYLSLNGGEDGMVFICYLKDGRYFTVHSSPEIYNKLSEFSYE